MTSSSTSTNRLLGIGLVLLSAIALAAQNVLLRLYFSPSVLFSQMTLGGWITPQIGNVVLLLALRMATMTLVLAAIAPQLYPGAFQALRQLPKTPRLLGFSLGSGLCLFVGQALLYLAMSQVAAGIAIAILFIYPAITFLLAWYFFHQRPRSYHLRWLGIIFLGVALTSLTTVPGNDANPVLGGLSAFGSGLSFGFYGIFAEVCLQSRQSYQALHPVPFSLFTFGIVASLASLTSVLIYQSIQFPLAVLWPVLGITLLSASLAVIAYVLNNFGIRYIGASLTALISASTPSLTTLFAWWLLQEALQSQQMVGIGLVTIGVAALSLKARHPSKKT